ncbi:uncharacterized protein DNF11_2076 [Malassezia restricta CBS 7877]|uniref:Thioesterase domain-containing protein n=1 Tax=Malassezia restricta (strain ATCC 96810 / NBRC 103918 / CBS 7877) TaxID=425264 RepID=A0A3G2S5G6_MALR7|nr:uncharacterized protein DNF11_2076 [Malassezia restricta CBS 7877]
MFNSAVLRTPCLRFVRRVHKWMLDVEGHDYRTTSPLSVVSARPGYMDARFSVKPEHLNRAGTMHGGVVMTLIDSGGSLAVATNGYRNTGVSTDINATFARPAGKAGDVIRVTSEIISMGKTLAYTRTELRDVDSNELLAYGSHTKYIRMGSKATDNVTFNKTGENVVSGKMPEGA